MENSTINNNTLTSKTSQKLSSVQDQLKTSGQQYAEYQGKIHAELNTVPLREDKTAIPFVEPVQNEKKEEKKNPLIKLLDKISAKINKDKPVQQNGLPVEEQQDIEDSYRGEDFLDTIGTDTELYIQDLIAPIDLEVDFNHLQMGQYYFRTLFVSGYPRFVGPNWLSPIINFEHSLRISTFYYPVDSKDILDATLNTYDYSVDVALEVLKDGGWIYNSEGKLYDK